MPGRLAVRAARPMKTLTLPLRARSARRAAGREGGWPKSPFGSGAGEDGLDLVLFVILAAHLIEDDRMPVGLATLDRDVMLPRPAAETKLLDQIDFRTYTARHNPEP